MTHEQKQAAINEKIAEMKAVIDSIDVSHGIAANLTKVMRVTAIGYDIYMIGSAPIAPPPSFAQGGHINESHGEVVIRTVKDERCKLREGIVIPPLISKEKMEILDRVPFDCKRAHITWLTNENQKDKCP